MSKIFAKAARILDSTILNLEGDMMQFSMDIVFIQD